VFGGWDAPVCYSDLFILDLSEFEVSSLSHDMILEILKRVLTFFYCSFIDVAVVY